MIESPADPKMRALVRKYLPGRDTREVIERIEREFPGRFKRESIIVACSQLRTWGSFSQAVVPNGPPRPIHWRIDITDEERASIELTAAERRILPHQVITRLVQWLINEDLVDACPTLSQEAMV